MKQKRTTQKLQSSKILDANVQVLYIKNLKKDTVLSPLAKQADYIFSDILGFSVSVLSKRSGNHFEVIEVEEDLHIQTEMIGKPELSKEVKTAEAFVKSWFQSQRTN